MRIIDMVNPQRVMRSPDKTIVVLSGGGFVEQGFTIKRVELRLFVEGRDERLGPYLLITALVQTDMGEVESVYDEGYRGENALESAASLLLNNLGLSAVILRSIIALEEAKKDALAK